MYVDTETLRRSATTICKALNVPFDWKTFFDFLGLDIIDGKSFRPEDSVNLSLTAHGLAKCLMLQTIENTAGPNGDFIVQVLLAQHPSLKKQSNEIQQPPI